MRRAGFALTAAAAGGSNARSTDAGQQLMAAPRRPSPDKAIDAALALAAARRWNDVSMRDVAGEAGIALADLRRMFASKDALVDAFSARVDAAVIAGTDADAEGEPARDRLFDVLARRFEALKPHRSAVGSIVSAGLGAPGAGLAAGCRLMRSMAWSLEAAGIGASGMQGRLRTKGLAAVYLAALAVFLRDDSPDLGRTMACLDRALGRADRLASVLCRFGGGGRFRPPREAAAEPAPR